MIAVWWIGEEPGNPRLLQRVCGHVEHEFGLPVRVWNGTARPAGTFDPRRRQHSSRAVLQWLIGQGPPDATRVLGVTDVDLCMPVLTFVFGEAQLGGSAAVVSLARLRERDETKTASRLTKECVHELGHTFGLLHCATPGCVMGRSGSVRAVDLKGARLCPACAARYGAFQQEGPDVYRQDQNPGRR